MRTSTFARAGALVTASALAFSLGAGPVSAAETTTDSAKAAAAEDPADSLAAASVVSGIRFSSGVITSAITTPFVGRATVAGTDGATASVTVNGRRKGNVAVYFSPDRTQIGLLIPRGWGAGKVRAYIGGNKSNIFHARRQVKTTRRDGYALRIRRVNSKITFKALQVKRVNPSTGKYVSAKKVKLQQRRNGKWRTIKQIKLNSKGNGSYSKRLTSKYRYRLSSSQTSTLASFRTASTGRI